MGAEMELGLYRWDKDNYLVDLRYQEPGQQAPVRPRQSAPIPLDLSGLAALAGQAAAYGERLWASLFADANVKTAFDQARANAEGRAVPLRLRLYISPNTPELHGLRWETLRDPAGQAWLTTGARLYFSRYVLSADWRPIRPPAAAWADVKVVLLIADPTNAASFKPGDQPLARVDVAAESRRARAALALADHQIWELSTGPQAAGRPTLNGLVDALQAGADFVYLVCHGALIRDVPYLYLEDDRGLADPVTGLDLVARLRGLAELPRLAVFASCQSAGTGAAEPAAADGGALAALGPRLAEAGVPAVVAMQGNVTMATAEALLGRFFTELRGDGQIDRALAVARAAVQGHPDAPDRPDWWMPALFLRLPQGNLWHAQPADLPDFPRWQSVVANLLNGRATAILGSGLLERLIGAPRQIAEQWAESYRFPLAPHDRDDLPQVAQFLAVTQDEAFPRAEYGGEIGLMRRILRRRFPSLRALPAGTPVDDLLVRAGQELQRADPAEAHAALARLPFPVYLTTNGDSLLAASLQAATTRDGRPKRPQVGACARTGRPVRLAAPWALAQPGVVREPPTEAAPLVYHLYGHLGEINSLVLTERDYFDFLLAFPAAAADPRGAIPSEVTRALTDATLVFLGFRLEEWDFRVLARCIRALEGSDLLGGYTQVAVQLSPTQGRFLDPASACRYLENCLQFGSQRLSIFWGSPEDFLRQLTTRVRAEIADLGEPGGDHGN